MFVLLMLLLHTGNDMSSINMHTKICWIISKDMYDRFVSIALKTGVLLIPVFTSAFRKKFCCKTINQLLEMKVTGKCNHLSSSADLGILGKTLAETLP